MRERDGCKEKVSDKESTGMDKGVEGRKKGYDVGCATPNGWGDSTRFAPQPLDGVKRSFFLLNLGRGVLA